jgi:hypothetical protein
MASSRALVVLTILSSSTSSLVQAAEKLCYKGEPLQESNHGYRA